MIVGLHRPHHLQLSLVGWKDSERFVLLLFFFKWHKFSLWLSSLWKWDNENETDVISVGFGGERERVRRGCGSFHTLWDSEKKNVRIKQPYVLALINVWHDNLLPGPCPSLATLLRCYITDSSFRSINKDAFEHTRTLLYVLTYSVVQSFQDIGAKIKKRKKRI